MKHFWIDVIKIALGVALGGVIALFGFIALIEFINTFAPWIFDLY